MIVVNRVRRLVYQNELEYKAIIFYDVIVRARLTVACTIDIYKKPLRFFSDTAWRNPL